MSMFQATMDAAVWKFVTEITQVAHRAAVDTLEASFGRPPPTEARDRSVGRPRGRRAQRGKRTAAVLKGIAAQFASFVADNPGLRIEQINKKLGTSTAELALPIRMLTAEGAIRMVGKKRSTTYFAANSGKAKGKS
jgi:hypothetical protein